jgi:hypothetical protein
MYKYGQRVNFQRGGTGGGTGDSGSPGNKTMMGQTQIVVEMMEVIEGLLSGVLQLEM